MHLVFCLGGLPPLPLDLGRAIGVEVPLVCRLGRAGAFPLLLLLRERAKWELPTRCRLPFPAPPTSLSLPNSHRTFHDVRIRGRLRSLASACYPPVVLDLRIKEQGRIRGPGHVGVALVDVTVVLALAPLPVRGQEVESVDSGHHPADSDAAVKQLQEDLRKVGEWSKKWQMTFNLDKCKIMHIGHKNKNEKYELLGKEIESVQQEKDLGVVITNDLKSSNQCIEAVKKAQKLLGYIKRQFRTRNKETILTLYNALVRPHLEYAVQFWSPSLRKDIERLEAVQARATKLIPSIRHLGYVRRLERLNLYSLEKRRLRGQLIETFKMLKGVNNIDYRHLFTFSNNRTRSNGWKLELKRFNTSQCGNFFTYKIAPIWNRLPVEAVNSASVEQFKIELDKVIDTLI